MVEIGRTRRLKRVSWAPGVSLCQVRLFLSEEAPCQSGLSRQDHLQPKDSWTNHASAGSTSDDSSLPPGFESVHNQNHSRTDIDKIPRIRWTCPPKIVLNPEWYVVSGEESQEIAKQNQRNVGVLEAIYPRQSTIPPNPSVSAEAQESCHAESLTQLVPLTAIEDDDPSDTFDSLPTQSEPSVIVSHQSNFISHSTIPPSVQVPPSNVTVRPSLGDMSVLLSRLGAHADVAAAAAAAVTALTSAEQGNLIDQNLLINILSDPSLIEKLLPENQKADPKQLQPSTASMAMSAPLPMQSPSPQHSAHLFNSANDPNPRPTRSMVPTTASGPLLPPPPLTHHNVPLFSTMRNTNVNPGPSQPMVTSTISTPVPPPPPPPPPPLQPHMPSFNGVRPNMVSSVATPPLPSLPPQAITTASRPLPTVTPSKDMNYYKTLIKQHGAETLGSTNSDVTGTGAGAMKFKGQQHGVSGTLDGTKSKFQKACAFFNTARGCRHGDSCMFLHESSINSRDERAKKRVKLDSSGIMGRI